MRKAWPQKLLIALAFYGTLALLIASSSKTLDLLLVGIMMGMYLVRSADLLWRLRIRHGPDGKASFRFEPAAFPGWRRWMLGDAGQRPLDTPKRP